MPRVAILRAAAAVAVAILLISFGPGTAPGWSVQAQEKIEPEVSPAAEALLKVLNNAAEKTLQGTPGLRPDVIAKVMAHRAAGKKFKNLVEFVDVTGASPLDLETLLKPYQQEEAAQRLEEERKAVPDPPAAGKAGGRLRRPEGSAPEPGGAPPGASGSPGPIGHVRSGYYSKLPGFDDLDKIDRLKRTEFLETVNREMCACGCQGETLAFCLVNDPGCPVIKARVKKIYDDIMTKPPR